MSAKTNDIQTDAWDDPQPLPKLLPDVEPFDEFLLPESFRQWVTDISNRMQVPIDMGGVAVMVALASVVGTQIRIKPKQQDDWTINPNIWGCVVGRAGVKKSPVLSEIMKPLNSLELAYRKDYEKATTEFEASKRVNKQMEKVVNQKIKKLLDDDKVEEAQQAALKLEEDTIPQPTRRRLVVNDVTIQKLGELLNENPNGLLLSRDELAGFLNSLDQQGNEEYRAFYLEAWNGLGSFTYDRIGRGTVHISNVSVCIMGGIQPSRIEEHVRRAARGSSGDDGFIQRMQLLVYPDMEKDYVYMDKKPDKKAISDAFAVFKRLANIDTKALGATQDTPDDIPYLRFDLAAQDVFVEWLVNLETRLRVGNLEPIMESHLAKYRKLVPALALLIHLAEGEQGGVCESATKRACAWAEYLESHAERIYSAVTSQELNNADLILKRIRQGKLKPQFTYRELQKKNWRGLNEMKAVRDAIALLEEHKHVMVEEYHPDMGGRPTEYIYINPKTMPS